MRKILIMAVMLAGTAMPAFAQPGGRWHVRNDTQRPLTCGVRRPRSEQTVPVALRPGAAWNDTTGRNETRTLICYNGARRQTFRMQSGTRYVLREDGRGVLWLRPTGSD
jgi:hypothetical protein